MDDVLIAGAGPTGLAAALFLAERGVRIRIVDKATERSSRSKAFGVNARTLDLLQDTGVSDRMLAEGWEMRSANIWRHGRRLFRIDFSGVEHRFPFMLVLSQARSEALLEEALAERGVHVERGTAVRHVNVRGPNATVILKRGGSEGETVTVSALLGADGAHSTVRQELDIGFPGTAYDEPWRLYDIELDTPLPPDEGNAFLLEDGAMLVLNIHDDIWRVIGSVPDPLRRLPPDTQVGRVEWKSDFRISHRLAERFRAGPVCLAGDAAHIHSPLGGRGMNLGIEDAYVFAALAAEDRLDEYDQLRRPVDRSVLRWVERMTELPRGRSLPARAARVLAPLLTPLFPLAAPLIRKWVLGLDHDVQLRAVIK